MRRPLLMIAIILISSGLLYAKDKNIILHYINGDKDTVFTDIYFQPDNSHAILLENDTELTPSGTSFIEVMDKNGKTFRGIPFEEKWLFKVHDGYPMAVYSEYPEKYKINMLYFSADEKKFMKYNRENLLQTFDGKAEALFNSHLKKKKLQKALLYSDVIAGAGLLLAPTPAGILLIGVGVTTTTASFLLEKPALNKLFDAVDSYNNQHSSRQKELAAQKDSLLKNRDSYNY